MTDNTPTLAEDIALIADHFIHCDNRGSSFEEEEAALARIARSLADLPHLEQAADAMADAYDDLINNGARPTTQVALWRQAERARKGRA